MREKAMKFGACLFFGLCSSFASTVWAQEAASTESGIWIEAEGGGVWQSRNEVRIPSESGTQFSLSKFDDDVGLTGRLYVGYRISPRHEVRALFAPLTLDLDGSFDRTILFQNETFSPAVPTKAKYRFNSYRLAYRYTFLEDGAWRLKVGFTGKIRDAEIELVQGSRRAARSNVGFVPLLNFSADYQLTSLWSLHFDADALAAPQGRAEDISFLFGYRVHEKTRVRAGYRTVEGGADGNGGVYNFTWLHYAIVNILQEF